MVDSVANVSGDSQNQMAWIIKNFFSAVDTNGDGLISQDELKAATDKFSNILGKKMASTSNSTANLDVTKLFASIDKNNDGSIDVDEMTQYLEQTGVGKKHHKAHMAHANDKMAADLLAILFQSNQQNQNQSVPTNQNTQPTT